MSVSLARKVEHVATLYMQSVIPTVLNIYEGHLKATVLTLPHLICYAEDTIPHPEMPTTSGVRIVNLRMELRADSTITARATLDAWRETLEDAMGDVDAIAAFITALNYDWDDYIIKVYDVIRENEPTEFDGLDWVEQFPMGVVCQLTPAPV